MQVKRYIADSVSQAMERAAKELDTEVVMVSSRNIKQKGTRSLFSKSMVEVVVGYDPDSIRRIDEQHGSVPPQASTQPPIQPQNASRSNVPNTMSPPIQSPVRPEVSVPPIGFKAPVPAADRLVNTTPIEAPDAPAYGEPGIISAPPQSGANAVPAAAPSAGISIAADIPAGDSLKPVRKAPDKTPDKTPDSEAGVPEQAEPFNPAAAESPASVLAEGPPGKDTDKSADSSQSAPSKRMGTIDNMLTSFINRFTFEESEISYTHSDYLTEYVNLLIAAHIDEKLAHTLITETDDAMQLSDTLEAPDALASLIEKKFGGFLPLSHKDGEPQRIVMLMGPSGAGKTNTIVKLSAEFALGQKRKIGIICADTDKLCGQELLRSYADALNASFTIAYQPSELKQALSSMADRDIIFIDPPCSGLGSSQQKAELRMVYNNCMPTDVFACFPSSASLSAACEMMRTYQFAENARIIITKLDEISDWSLCINLCWLSRKPIAYLLQGQTITESADTINIHTVIENILT